MRRPFIAGNWKMYKTVAEAVAFVREIRFALNQIEDMDIAVCPPFIAIPAVAEALAATRIGVGAQNMHAVDQGAYTGEVSGAMLADFGCRYVLVGHSERRSFYGDTDAVVAAKFAAALKAGITPVLCVGESLGEREAGVTLDVVTRQIDAVLSSSGVAAFSRAVVAYEPVWAIGTGRTASPAQAQEVHALIRQRFARDDAGVASRLQILYGGSVKPGNAKELFCQPDIDGGLIGGASLVADDFLAICAAA